MCAEDSYCCDTEWDNLCVSEVDTFECGTCVECGDGECNGLETCETCPLDCGWCEGEGVCCEANGTPGCEDFEITVCVCEQDSYCCESEWDNLCASEVEEFGCGVCDVESCCVAHETPGCSDPDVEACVCADDDWCCSGAWDKFCVAEVDELGCGSCAECGDGECNGLETCETCQLDCGWCEGEGVCCEANGTPGCEDFEITVCVCEQDSYCCESEWDNLCANEVDQLGCGLCSECGDGECAPLEGCLDCPEDCGDCADDTCCVAHEGPGCMDEAVMECVCDLDPYCCTTKWDGQCAMEADDCGSCDGDCCEPNGTPGCEDEDVESCVCQDDSFCCTVAWDQACAEAVEILSCGLCVIIEPTCGDNHCDEGEYCANCPEDCGECTGGPCCEAHEGTGCDDPAIAACVCASDSWCCEVNWDDICVGRVEEFQCGVCGGVDPFCGDFFCDEFEDCETCPEDCGDCPPDPFCGDSFCDEFEDCDTCPEDCGDCPPEPLCGDGVCGDGEDAANCCDDCGPCVPCPGICECDIFCCIAWDDTCQAECDGTDCGDGVCSTFEECYGCPDDCGVVEPFCGDGICDNDEDPCTCGEDCPNDPLACEDCECADGVGGLCSCDEFCFYFGNCCDNACDVCGGCPPEPFCGDFVCDADEDCETCPEDCGACPQMEGTVFITEIMYNPKQLMDDSGEWFEVHNSTAMPIDIEGWEILYKNYVHMIDNGADGLIVPPMGYLVLGISPDALGGLDVPFYSYDDAFNISNSTPDFIFLYDGEGNLIDEALYEIKSAYNGASLQLSNVPDLYNAVGNDDPANYCASAFPYETGDSGTPGMPNVPCIQ